MTATEKRIDVFFYGLFMDDELLRKEGIDPQNRRLARVQDFALLIGERATLIAQPGQTVHGVLFSLSHTEIDKLYSNASVSVYRPEAVKALSPDGAVVAALCFNLPTPPSTSQRNREYAAKLKELAKRIGLPEHYVQSI